MNKFYSSSESAWTAMLRSIRSAKTAIYWEIYIFNNDTLATHDFVGALTERAKAGVRVRIVADGFGSLMLDKTSIKRLTDAGAEVIFYNHPFWRTHRKILIVDDRILFLGGVNIGDSYRRWADLHVRITSRPVVRALLKTFARFYAHCGGTDPEVLKHSKAAQEKGATSDKTNISQIIVEHLPNFGSRQLHDVYEEQLQKAKTSVTIVSPYFQPTGWLVRSLKKLAEQGVQVDIILPEHSDPRYADWVNREAVPSLVKSGVRFYFTKEMVHAKVLIIDRNLALVGSQNVDPISFWLTMETGVFIRDRRSLDDLQEIMEGWKNTARSYDPKLDSISLIKKLLVQLWKLLVWFFNV